MPRARTRTYQTGAARGRDIESPVDVTLREAFTGSKRIVTVDGERLEVTIPAGVKTGSKIRMSGQGGRGAGGGPARRPLPDSQRAGGSPLPARGDDLVVDVPVDLFTAVLGGEARVPTLDGKELIVTIRAWHLERQEDPAARQGDPELKGGAAGDLLARIEVEVPPALTDEQRELFEQLREMR